MVSADRHFLEMRFMQDVYTNICQAVDPLNTNNTEYSLLKYKKFEPRQFIFLKSGAISGYFSSEHQVKCKLNQSSILYRNTTIFIKIVICFNQLSYFFQLTQICICFFVAQIQHGRPDRFVFSVLVIDTC